MSPRLVARDNREWRAGSVAMNLVGLDDATRRTMLAEFDAEEAGGRPYRSSILSPVGLAAFATLMRAAIAGGDEESLTEALRDPTYWLSSDARGRTVNVDQRAESLAITEFNTWYVRGLARRLLDEGEAACEIYRAGMPRRSPSGCTCAEGEMVQVRAVYEGHRARYWPVADPTAFSVPFGPTCHHSIRRVAHGEAGR